jgi:hypothetical protein
MLVSGGTIETYTLQGAHYTLQGAHYTLSYNAEQYPLWQAVGSWVYSTNQLLIASAQQHAASAQTVYSAPALQISPAYEGTSLLSFAGSCSSCI